MKPSETWKPLLEGDLAGEAWQAVQEVAAALKEPGGGMAADPTVSSGSAGVALFYTYLAQILENEAWADAAVSHFDLMVEAVSSAPLRPGLYSGLVGVGWTIEHLRGRLFDAEEEDEEDGNREIDETLLAALRRPWTGDYDLIRGLVGMGVYACERLPRPDARQSLLLLLVQLNDSAVRTGAGVTWHTRAEWLPPDQRERFPQGYYNLGMAHGVAGVVALLGTIAAVGLLDSDARPLLDGAVSWLLAQERPPDSVSRFPNFVVEGIETGPSRLAWCYGDLGIAVALVSAARGVGNAAWEQEAVRIALDAAGRNPDYTMVNDPGLCHGAAGVGHLFHRLYRATGEERLAEAARFWLRRTLELRQPGEGIAGFLAWDPEPGGGGHWEAERGFLTGAAGVGLALLAALAPLDPAWDRLLAAPS
jgi:lantibiotic biosynthesis protein